MNRSRLVWHALALITVSVWGVTFISTKILISYGLTPVAIFVSRFLMAYLTLLLFCHKRLLADSWKDEILLFAAGLCGGSLYFITENTALELTYASNVSLLICTAPLFTVILTNLAFKIKFRASNIIGSCMAFIGVGIVVFDGSITLDKSWPGDILTIVAAILWALYCLLLKIVNQRYGSFFITRKVFFYGLVSAAFYMVLMPDASLQIDLWREPVVLWNLRGCLITSVNTQT